MGDYITDVRRTLDLLTGNEYENYSYLYAFSNEDLKALFSNFSVKDKDVFCVLASSDQMFYSYLNGARSVDTFDINILTNYYYYLRKWIIDYYDSFYPEDNINNMYISELLKKVKVKSYDEEQAYNYWKLYTNTIYGYLSKKLFYKNTLIDTNNIKDLSKLKEILNNNELNFINIDISDDNLEINKKYDVIITSNLSEYFNCDNLKIKRYKRNLDNLLKDDGVIINSHIFSAHGCFAEKRIFGVDYNIVDFPFTKDKLGEFAVGCSYKRKVLTKKC